MDCPIKIRLTKMPCEATKDGFCYKITKLCLIHQNHPTTKEVVTLYPENRRVEINDTMKAVCSMSSTRPIELKKFIEEETHQKILISDVYNIKTKLKIKSNSLDEEQIASICEEINLNGGFSKICIDHDQVNEL
jgi:hypothetical protein